MAREVKRTKKEQEYTPIGVPATISTHVKITLKVRDNFISVDSFEERTIDPELHPNMKKEWQALYDEVYAACDREAAFIVEDMISKK